MDRMQPTEKHPAGSTGETITTSENSPFSLQRFFSIPGITLVLVIALGGGALMYVKKHHIRMATIGVFDSRLQNLENTVLEQEKRITQLEEETARPAPAATPPVPHASPVTLAPPAPPAAANPAVTAQPDDRIAALEKEISAVKAASPLEDKDKLYHSIRLLSSFHRLSSKVLSGKPFAAELSEFEDLYGEDASLDKPLAALSPYADSGVPAFAVLLSSFDDAMAGLKAEDAVPPAGATLWQRLVYNFTHLITVRRINGAQGGTSVAAILGRAEAHLDVQETQAAITEISSLPDSARSHFTAWMEDAQISLQAPDLLDQLEEGVMQKAFYTGSAGTAAPAGDDAAPAIPPADPAAKGN